MKQVAGLGDDSGGGNFDPEMELKPRRFNPAAVAVVLLLIAAGVGVMVFGAGKSAERMTVEQRMVVQKDIFVLPQKEQVVQWRKWAADKTANEDLRCEALSQLALLGDPEGIKLAVAALAEPNHKVRGTVAQVLAHYGSPQADVGKPALLAALEKADVSDRRQIIWALVELNEPTIYKTAMDFYRSGALTSVQRLEGGTAFNPVKIANLVSLDELAKQASDESAAIRQLVASILSENAEPKWIKVLVQLVRDPEVVVAREAASGLGRIADESAREPLVEALRKADKESRLKFLQALRDGIGGEGLVLALDTVAQEPEQRNWFQLRQLFDMMHELADPRVGDSLVEWVERTKPHKHWETEAGIVLAEVGDARGAKYIGARMGVENKDIYIKEKFWQADAGGHMTRTDRPRVIGARMLADLAILRPDKREDLLESAEDAVLEWLTSRPQPHANGLRFLAAVDSKKGLKPMRDWAFPTDELPKEGQQPPFPGAFEVAQSALRYIGWMRDNASFPKLLEQFDRKEDDKMDITQQGLEGAGLAMLGMALRAVTYGAANGLAQWGTQKDTRAEDKLIEFIEDELWHEEARMQACYALAWVASDETMKKVVEKVGQFAAKDKPRQQLIGACYAGTLSRRPVPEAVGLMVDALRPELEVNVRGALGLAIGVTGLQGQAEAEKKLFAMLENPEIRNPAALALILGGSPDTASRTVAMFADEKKKDALPVLKDLYFRAFGYWSDKDLDRGSIYRWVENAHAISRVKIGDAPQEWAVQRLKAQFDNLQFDNGPHSETRVVLRYRLVKAAREGDSATKRAAIATLKFMKERGSLMALRQEKGETGEVAAKAFHELMNPRLSEPEDLSHLKDDN